METINLEIGKMYTFNYDRNFIQTERYMKRDGIKVIVDSKPWVCANSGQTFVSVKFGIDFCGIMPVMIQELSR